MTSDGGNESAHQVFLMGAGRSGSTLLYKVLCLHPELGYISHYDNQLPQWLPLGWMKRMVADNLAAKRRVWFEADGNAYGFRRSMLNKLMPWPVEGENVYRRSGIPLEGDFDSEPDSVSLNRLREQLGSLRRAQGTPLFLNKRVANNRRIGWLKAGFPNARYIHLIRDGRDVAYSFSQVDWWQESSYVWWAGKTMRELMDEGEDFMSVTARTWSEATAKVADELAALPADQVLEVRYESFLAEPIEQIGRMLRFMGLDLPQEVEQTMESLQLAGRPPRWRDRWDQATYERVLGQQRAVLERFGYEI